MKKFAFALLSFLALNSAYASDGAQINLHISDAARTNQYFLCIYGAGCFSIKDLEGKSFPIMPMDLGNVTEMVVTDVNTMRMYMQPSANSCNININSGQTVTISGNLVVTNKTPHINNLSCKVA